MGRLNSPVILLAKNGLIASKLARLSVCSVPPFLIAREVILSRINSCYSSALSKLSWIRAVLSFKTWMSNLLIFESSLYSCVIGLIVSLTFSRGTRTRMYSPFSVGLLLSSWYRSRIVTVLLSIVSSPSLITFSTNSFDLSSLKTKASSVLTPPFYHSRVTLSTQSFRGVSSRYFSTLDITSSIFYTRILLITPEESPLPYSPFPLLKLISTSKRTPRLY